MVYRSRVISLLAAAALSLSIVTGATAQGAETSVRLVNGAGCAAVISAGGFDFGTWTWDGTRYVNPVTAVGNITVDVTNAVFGVDTCTVPLDVSPLTGELDPAESIPTEAVTLSSTTANVSGTNPFTAPQNLPFTIDATLDADLGQYPPDTYTGTITVGVFAAAP